MSTFMLVFARPFFYFAIAVLVLLPARMAVQRWMRDGALKRLLLREIHRRAN
jgi:hypothetical protein